MPVFHHRSHLPYTPEAVFSWHMRPGALERLTPPWAQARVLEREGEIHDGGKVVLAIKQGPTELKWVSPQFIEDGVELAIAEMLLGGTTCFNDMYFFPDATIEACREAAMRVSVGITIIEFESAWGHLTPIEPAPEPPENDHNTCRSRVQPSCRFLRERRR